jgi:medium-chain acyl-[acyl-carrier-protein] hydrolase
LEIIDHVFRETFRIKSHEVDSFNKVHPLYYFLLMQEVAGYHAYKNNLSIPHLLENKKTWVVTRTKMTIFDYAKWPSTIKVETWPQKPWQFYFPRVCRAFNSNDELLFESLSHWVVVDISNNRPVKPENFDYMKEPQSEPAIINPDLGRRIQFKAEGEKVTKYKPEIRYSDTDLNMHINNVTYLQWILDSFPFDFRDQHQLQEVDITYLAQTFRDEEIVVSTSECQDSESVSYLHQISSLKEKEIPVCNAKTKWIKRA